MNSQHVLNAYFTYNLFNPHKTLWGRFPPPILQTRTLRNWEDKKCTQGYTANK